MNQTAVITGASSGFGQAIARKLAQNGYQIVAIARRSDRLRELQEELGSPRICTLALDLRDRAALREAFLSLPKELSRIGVLVNAAGLALGQESFEHMEEEDIDTMIDTNIRGLLSVSKEVIPLLRANGGGHIFNFGSIAALYPYPGSNIYAGTKAFVAQFSLTLRNDLRKSNIKVTLIEPGLAKTEFSWVRFKGDVARSDAVYKDKVYLSANDIAQSVFALLSLPSHVNVNRIEIMPVSQSWNPLFVED